MKRTILLLALAGGLELVAFAQTAAPTVIEPNIIPLYLLQAGAWGMLWYVLWFVTHDGKEMLRASIDSNIKQAVSNEQMAQALREVSQKIDALGEITGRRIKDDHARGANDA